MENALSTPETMTDSRLRRWWKDPSIRRPTLIFVAVRVLTLLIALVAVHVGTVNNPYVKDPIYLESLQSRQPGNILTPLVDPWHRWDTGWYLKIAQFGYSATDGTVIFAPLYPALIAVVGNVVGDKLLAGLIVSSMASFAFLICFYKLARFELNYDRAAFYAVLSFVIFPTAFYLMAAYTEATFLAFVAGTFLAAHHRHWWVAALLIILATLTRIQGALLFLPIGWMAFVDAPRFWQDSAVTWGQRLRQAVPRAAAVGVGPLTALAFYAYLAINNLGSVTDAYKQYWALDVRLPWDSVIEVIRRIATKQASFTEVAGFVALLFIVALILYSIGKLAVPYILYMVATLALVLMRFYSPTLLNGMMRYVLDFFPAFMLVGAALAKHRLLRPAWFYVGAITQIALLYLFACWQWIA